MATSRRAGTTSGGLATGALVVALAIATGPLAGGGGGDFVDCNNNGVDDPADIAGGTSADCNGNGIPDECDIASGVSQDCNGNGIPDLCDVASGFSDDCNGNEVPDQCEALDDCNGNQVPDECDVASGFSDDCNGNGLPDECENDCNGSGVPDECDVLNGTSQDCNGNGLPDECDVLFGLMDCNHNLVPDQCELIQGLAHDCNGNGFLDVCDIASGTSTDCDGNGVPDECQMQMQDCNANGILDICDIDSGASPDCNSNAIPDECEVVHLTAVSPALSPIGTGVPQQFTVFNVPVAGTDVTIRVEARADLGAVVEKLNVLLNGVPVGTLFEQDGHDCPDEPDVAEIIMSESLYSVLVPGPNAVISVFASAQVDPALPFCQTYVKLTLDYQAVTAGDENGNGIPDECDCREDFDGDGDIGFSDLILFLSAWGPCPGCPADLNDDGTVNFADLILFLARWGPCVFVVGDP